MLPLTTPTGRLRVLPDIVATLADITHGPWQMRKQARDHEMRNIIGGLTVASDVLTSGLASMSSSERDSVVAGMCVDIRRLSALVEPAGREPGTRGPASIPTEVAGLVAEAIAARRVRDATMLEVQEPATALCDPEDLRLALSNCLSNCDRYAPGSPVRVRVGVAAGGRVRVEIADSGPGPLGARDVAGSTGRGLRYAARALRVHGGTVALQRAAEGGTVAVIELPLAPIR